MDFTASGSTPEKRAKFYICNYPPYIGEETKPPFFFYICITSRVFEGVGEEAAERVDRFGATYQKCP